MPADPDAPLSAPMRTLHCKSVRRFLAALNPRRAAFATLAPRGWIYRGMPDDMLPLLPAALRPAPSLFRTAPEIVTNEWQVNEERRVMAKFLNMADSVGLHVPEDSQDLRRDLNPDGWCGDRWPPPRALSVMALAQHYGVPTRLLDWSRHPLKAALFAAMNGGPNPNAERICVWALNTDALRIIRLKAGDTISFSVVTAPSATNSNLRAQEGCFILGKSVSPTHSEVDRTTFHQVILQWITDHNIEFTGTWIQQITLPRSMIAELRYELALEGVTRATLFPDFWGVVKAMADDEDWFRPQTGVGVLRAEKHLSPYVIRMRVSSPPKDPARPDSDAV